MKLPECMKVKSLKIHKNIFMKIIIMYYDENKIWAYNVRIREVVEK